MDQSEHRTRWPQGQRVANGGSVGNSLAPGPTARTPNRTQVHSRFNSVDLGWHRRVHVRHSYPPRELANGEFETRFCNVCPMWRWPDIGGNALRVARPNAKAYGDKTVASRPAALRDRRHARPMPTRNAKLPPCLRHGRWCEHSTHYGACPKNETSRFFLFFSAHWPAAAVR